MLDNSLDGDVNIHQVFSSPTNIIFGKEGAYSISNNETLIGSYKALVCDDNALLKNLVSPNPLFIRTEELSSILIPDVPLE